jgi:pimeloyl-ACP methyl ester carboxylesterase
MPARAEPFLFENLPARVAVPAAPAPGRPWAWRPEFFGAFSAVDDLLLAAGWHLLHLSLENNYGSPAARAAYARFLPAQIASRGLAPSGVFIGLSRGGLSALHLALDHPGLCAALYLDNPVCDYRSWPGGLDGGPGSPGDWEKLLSAHALTDAEARASASAQPLARLTPAFIRRTPLALVGGDTDEIVPWPANGARLAALWREHAGPLLLEIKPGARHHPHGPTDPAAFASFLVASAAVGPHPLTRPARLA